MDAPLYLRPTSIGEALQALAMPGIRILAGGTDFYPARGERPIAEPVLDVTAIPELRGIEIRRDEIRIGGGTSWTAIIAAPLPACFDALKQAAREVGSVQIQNRGTIAGNLCNASPAADGVPPLLTLDASVELVSRSGTRRLALADFITGNRRTERRSDEIVAAIVVPRSIDGASCFLKLGARRYLVISIAMVAAILERDGKDRIAQARIAVGSCSAVAQRLRDLERDVVGVPCAAGIGKQVAAEHLAALSPIDDVRATAAYRVDAARTLIGRALERCAVDIAR
ncbi:MAG: xanthine dehydrogenase family protein subunit M [Dongiaceae bacterium]